MDSTYNSYQRTIRIFPIPCHYFWHYYTFIIVFVNLLVQVSSVICVLHVCPLALWHKQTRITFTRHWFGCLSLVWIKLITWEKLNDIEFAQFPGKQIPVEIAIEPYHPRTNWKWISCGNYAKHFQFPRMAPRVAIDAVDFLYSLPFTFPLWTSFPHRYTVYALLCSLYYRDGRRNERSSL